MKAFWLGILSIGIVGALMLGLQFSRAAAPQWDTSDPLATKTLPPIVYPSIEVVESNATSHFDGTFTVTRVVKVRSVYAPQILIVEVFADEIVDLSIKAYEQGKEVRIYPDVDKSDTKSAAIAHPYGHYRITLTTRKNPDVRFNLRFE